MPLTFLTAERALDEAEANAAAEPALPYEDRERWRRPYRPGPWRVASGALLLLLAAYLFVAAMIIAVAGALPGAGVCAGLGLVAVVSVVRLVRTGVWVSEEGLRQAGFFSTTTLPWAKVGAVRTVQQPVKWLGLPRTVQGQALRVEPVGGEPLRALLTTHNADFLRRGEAFDAAADVIEGWAATRRR